MDTTKVLDGLGEAEAQALLAKVGPNLLHAPQTRSLIQIAFGALREPMFLFLLVAAGLYLVIGDLAEGLLLTGGAAISVGLVVLQEARSGHALAALQRLAEPVARVVRGGRQRRIPAADLVPGDILLIQEGDRLPADARLIAGDVLTLDESVLTGESASVMKAPLLGDWRASSAEPGVDGSSDVFAGTLNLNGQATARVTRTGALSRLGRIGKSLSAIPQELTPLQKTTGRLIKWLGLFALGFCLLVTVAYGVLAGSWTQGALAGLTLAISLLPEEFPMVLTVFMAIGAWRLAGRRVLVRRAAAIETLGQASMLCVDKTGTLTENRMTVASLWPEGAPAARPPGETADPAAGELLRFAALACPVRPVDPMDQAVRALARTDLPAESEPERTFPLTPGRLAVIQFWGQPHGFICAAKGAPETVFGLCRLDAPRRAALAKATEDMARRGLRVLGVAGAAGANDMPDDPEAIGWSFKGLIGFDDPVREEVPAALAEARRAGVQVAMITGDYPATALQIAREAGIDAAAGMLSGEEVAALSSMALAEKVRTVRVFARVRPEHKLALVSAFKAAGEVVAMTGDGVNDAPALEAAHIGVAMGQRGSDVAREAADIILLDDRFGSIVAAIALGRRIFANLRKALTFITAIHVPIAGLAILPILLGLPPILFPVHVVVLELLIDPICSLVFEAEPAARDAMRRPPRPRNEPLFGMGQMALAILQGVVVLGGVFGLYVVSLASGMAAEQARGAAFLTLVAANIVLALANSAEFTTALFDPRHAVFWAIAAVGGMIMTVAFAVPAAGALFQVTAPSLPMFGLCLSIAALAGGWWGAVRALRAWRRNPQGD